MTLHKNYVLDENKKPVAVILPLNEFEKLESIIEDHGLSKLMDETNDEESFSVSEAKGYYSALIKNVED